jgi:ferritin-like metal-binding protein YciE
MGDERTQQLRQYLTDAHSIEEQALAQLRNAPDLAGDPDLAAAFRGHLEETEGHERIVRERLDALGGSPSRVKDVVMALGGKGFVLFAGAQPDTPGKLTAHAYSYEALEEASYDLLRLVAERFGDAETAADAERIGGEERAMKERLAALFDQAASASLQALGRDDLVEQLRKYLADAHAIEAQALQLLERGPKIAGDPELARIYAEHREETRTHSDLVEQRLEALGGSTSALKDAALRLGALNWGGFFQAHPDTPGKLAAFAYAFEHLEIGGYEQLARVARSAGDEQTAALAERILADERAAASRIQGAFPRAASASLEEQGVA